jgi:hypothetical protein
VTEVLGLLGMLVWIVSVIVLAAGVTYLVVKLSPDDKKKAENAAETSS